MRKLRVDAYCRVSTNHEEQDSSLEAQTSYYGKLVAEHENWELVKIYAERASRTQMKKQRSFTEDFLLGKRKKKAEKLSMYFTENDHKTTMAVKRALTNPAVFAIIKAAAAAVLSAH